MFKSFKLAIKQLFSNPVRTGLTTLGIVIGIATVVLVLSAGEGFRGLISAQMESFGANAIYIETRVPPTTKNRGSVTNADSSRAQSAVAITTMKNRDVEDIKRLPNIKNAYGAVFGQKVVSYKDVVKSSLIFAASASRFEIDKSEFSSGRFYTAGEDSGAAQVAILGSELATDLFGGEDPLNKLIRVGDLNFTVIGVYKSKGALGGMNNDQSVFLPLNTAQKKLLGIDYLGFIIAQAYDNNLAEATREDIRAVMRRNHNIQDPEKEDFQVTTQEQNMETFNTIFSGITYLLIAIAAISLIVGGVGIMNIMYVVVTERTAEIGLKKALGATGADILREFLIESVLVTAIGGLFGILLGAFLGWLVSVAANYANLEWAFTVPLYAVLLGLGVAGGIGLIFGVLPARSASKMDPVEAMRYE